MKRVVVTNNRKVEHDLAGKAEVVLLDKASSLDVLQEGLKAAENGARLMLDPTRRKGYYKSLVFYVDESVTSPDEKSISLLNKSMTEAAAQGSSAGSKEPILAGILQSRDLDLVRSIIR
ncbi:MAG: hypothetical protein PHC91_07450 [Eubacteriales bacterium]|nr:hypothetical protein [Eubacteriales bacterium]